MDLEFGQVMGIRVLPRVAEIRVLRKVAGNQSFGQGKRGRVWAR